MRGIDYCKRILKRLESQGFSKEVPRNDLVKAIMLEVSWNRSTIRRYLQIMEELELIKKIGNGIYELNHEKIKELDT